jgi:Tfp pilus assembly pilus retraction ATPase PilT
MTLLVNKINVFLCLTLITIDDSIAYIHYENKKGDLYYGT